MGLKMLTRLFIVILSACVANTALASIITPSHSATRYLPNHVGTEDFLYVAPPNAAGLSINYFSRLEVTERLKIVNTPSYHADSGEPIASANTVVIITNGSMTLSSAIDIVGPATDLVLISSDSSGSGDISCSNCTFSNALQISLISGQKEGAALTSASQTIGTWSTKGSIDIDSLFAPGITRLNIIGDTVTASGEININQAAMKSTSGGYSAVAHGRYEIGSGGIDLVMGPVRWNYEKGQLLTTRLRYIANVLEGDFKAPRVNVTSAGTVRLEGSVDTRVDALSAVSFKEHTNIPQEGITIQALLTGFTYGSVEVRGDLYSDNEINIRSTRSANLTNSSHIKAKNVQVLAGTKVFNRATIEAEVVSMAGDELVNEGTIDAISDAHLLAENDLSNQYGGIIRASNIYLDSENKVVRNGSRTPYQTRDQNRNNFLDLEASEILSNLTSYDRDPISSVLARSNSSEIGAYYLLPSGFMVANRLSYNIMPESHKAHIIGKNIVIRAPAFENINPYFEYVEDDEQLTLSRKRIDQVMVAAENSIEIQGPKSSNVTRSDYFLNASAVLSLNSDRPYIKDGQSVIPTISVQTERFINQRYRIATYLVGTTFSASAEFASKTKVYSPPGFISVLGLIDIDATQYFANVMGYFEVFKGAKIETPQLRNLGLQNQSFTVQGRSSLNRVANRSGRVTVKNPSELDSLFSVNNFLDAGSANAWFTILNPFEYFLTEAAENRSPDVLSVIRGNQTLFGDHNYENCDWGFETCIRKTIDGSSIKISVKPDEVLRHADDNQIEVSYTATINSEIWSAGGDGKIELTAPNQPGKNKFSLIETLEKYYQKVKGKLTELIEEFDWWGLAE